MKKIWNEKYRPNNINAILQPDIKQLIFQKSNLDNLPHLLFYGKPGSGKTTTVLSICKYIYNSDAKIINERVLELNASDDRGINIVREKIKTFAAKALNKYENIPFFKIIILDEADVMTHDSQFALRRIIEQYSHITRFILICNYVTKIIPPLVSRCSKFKFDNLNVLQMKPIIENILINEKINYNTELLDNINETIYNTTKGDLRKTITVLQRTVYIASINKTDININIINEIIGTIPKELILEFYNIISHKVNTYKIIMDILTKLINSGYSNTNIINEISLIILHDKNILDNKKILIFKKMSNICNLLSSGSGDYIQLLTICSFINNILS